MLILIEIIKICLLLLHLLQNKIKVLEMIKLIILLGILLLIEVRVLHRELIELKKLFLGKGLV